MQKVVVMCDGAELPWSFKFGSGPPRKDTCVTVDGPVDPGFVIRNTIGPSIINVRGIAEVGFAESAPRRSASLSEEAVDRRRDDNLRGVFGG